MDIFKMGIKVSHSDKKKYLQLLTTHLQLLDLQFHKHNYSTQRNKLFPLVGI